jgi:hypothetical protein
MSDGSDLCADCATEATSPNWPDGTVKEHPQYDVHRIVSIDQHEEGSPIDCDGCSKSIKSAHGDRDGCITCQELTTEDNAHGYRQADDDDQPLYEDARDGDPVCWEHARHCRFCRKVFAPCQFENHIISQECEGLSRLSRMELLELVFPPHAAVLVPRRDGQDKAHGVVLGITDWETITVLVDDDGEYAYTEHFSNWAVKRADIHAV